MIIKTMVSIQELKECLEEMKNFYPQRDNLDYGKMVYMNAVDTALSRLNGLRKYRMEVEDDNQ